MGICSSKPNKQGFPCKEFTNPSVFTATRVLHSDGRKKKAELKRHRVETFLDEGVRQNSDRCSIVAIEIEPGEIEYAAGMVQASSTSFKKGRDNIRFPLNNDLTLSIDPNSS